MKPFLLLMVLVLVGCGKEKTPAAKQPAKEPTRGEKLIGAYELDGDIIVFQKSGMMESYVNGRKEAGEYKWKIVDKEVHVVSNSGVGRVWGMNPDGSLIYIALIQSNGNKLYLPRLPKIGNTDYQPYWKRISNYKDRINEPELLKEGELKPEANNSAFNSNAKTLSVDPVVEEEIRRQLNKHTGQLTEADLEKVTELSFSHNTRITAEETRNADKKLTPEQVEEILAYEIGRWETTGQGIPTGGEPQVIENTMDVRWREKGKSLEYEFSLIQNGKKVTYLGHKTYDHAQSSFIVHLKWGDNPETITHEVYDPNTRTYQGQSAPTSPPSKNTSKNLIQRVSNDKLLNTLQVFEDGQLVYVQQLVSLRQPANTEPANTEPANSTPDDAITAIQKLGGKVTVDANNDAIKVRLGYSKITDAGLEHLKELTKLKELLLNNTDITDAGLLHLKGLANLELLIIRKTKITDAGLVHLNGLTKLQGLGLTRTNVTDAALVHVESLTNLERLWLTDTGITDAGLVHLKGMTNLQGLNLSNTKVSDAGLVHLKAMTSLQGLGLWDTKVTDAGLVHLEGLAKLEALGLKNTQVSDAAVKKFQQALPSCKVER